MIDNFLDLLFPRTCVHCATVLSAQENNFCLSCESELSLACDGVDKSFLAARNTKLQVFEQLLSCAKYDKSTVIQSCIHAIKYRKEAEIAGHMTTQMRASLWDLTSVTYVVPVPSTPEKVKQRGYNQAELIASEVARWINKPLLTAVLNQNLSLKNQSWKSRFERWQENQNVITGKEGAFSSNDHVLLIDDVLTTGNTLLSCQKAIAASGCNKISAATFAYA